MKIHEIHDAEGRLLAFEVDNAFIGRSTVASIVRTINGAELLELHRSWWRVDEFCRFRIAGVEFRVWEPFGDNSRYWVGPEPPHVCPETSMVRGAFEAYEPVLRRPLLTGPALLLGGLVAGVLSRGAPGETDLRALAEVMSLCGLLVTGVAAFQWLDNAKHK
jgi:hypothetical protein